ncbi:MAG TPA: hypothetical protein VFI73_01705 [Candidatus Nitrosopolaris sp.]|nr:hypothetical protein [Candidatus Nitrosopolaris sp.]
MKNGLFFNSKSTTFVLGNVILLITLAISLTNVDSTDAASNNIIPSLGSNSTHPPKPLLGSQTFLTVTTKVNGGTKKPSDFTINVSGNSPSPKSFSGSSSGTTVTLFGGSYKVTESGNSGYSPSYSSGCSGTATGGRIQCTITNQYHGTPTPPNPTPNKGISLTSNSVNVYSIPSTSVQIAKFLTNYTISGEISTIYASRDLITSTIIKDFDSSPNIGYVKSNNSATTSPNAGSQVTLPNPFVSTETINQKIANETHNIIIASSKSNPAGKNVEIKCTFGDVLSTYRCSHIA